MKQDSKSLEAEFVTVDAVLRSGGSTSSVDAFILTWVKMEKQFRRIFCFVVFQNPTFSDHNVNEVITVIVENKELFFATFMHCIDRLGPPSFRDIVGAKYDYYFGEIGRIQSDRNKILHGQVTGKGITSAELKKDIGILREWIALVAKSSNRDLGYDGVTRNTVKRAKATSLAPKRKYPFATVEEFRHWLKKEVKVAKQGMGQLRVKQLKGASYLAEPSQATARKTGV